MSEKIFMSRTRSLHPSTCGLYSGAMKYDFDQDMERKGTDSVKWGVYPGDVIPLWIADMDFRSPEPVIEALRARVDHGIFGYGLPWKLAGVLLDRIKKLYNWVVDEPQIQFLPGIVPGLNVAFQAFAAPGEGVLAQPPLYFPILRNPAEHGRILQDPPLVRNGDSYEIDFDRFEDAITDATRIFVLCNPHNPVGRVYTKPELVKIAEICLRRRLILCSDEIHCDLVYPPHHHIPVATLSPEVEDRTVTLMAPSKTYNVAGLECGFALIKNAELRKAWRYVSHGILPGVNLMGIVAAAAGYGEGQEWLEQVLAYLQGNRDFLYGYFREKMPELEMCKVEATYMAWLDCRNAGIPGNPAKFFLEQAQVALSDGADFGKGGKNFVRMNFACPRNRLVLAVDRMRSALGSL